mmetsp:Transcript_27368/g.71671  ORF Transcript_27368/g.71671 Transcript_27368/m.71671 type:complete len:321 (-) Transcript_27368:6-968(-)
MVREPPVDEKARDADERQASHHQYKFPMIRQADDVDHPSAIVVIPADGAGVHPGLVRAGRQGARTRRGLPVVGRAGLRGHQCRRRPVRCRLQLARVLEGCDRHAHHGHRVQPQDNVLDERGAVKRLLDETELDLVHEGQAGQGGAGQGAGQQRALVHSADLALLAWAASLISTLLRVALPVHQALRVLAVGRLSMAVLLGVVGCALEGPAERMLCARGRGRKQPRARELVGVRRGLARKALHCGGGRHEAVVVAHARELLTGTRPRRRWRHDRHRGLSRVLRGMHRRNAGSRGGLLAHTYRSRRSLTSRCGNPQAAPSAN